MCGKEQYANHQASEGRAKVVRKELGKGRKKQEVEDTRIKTTSWLDIHKQSWQIDPIGHEGTRMESEGVGRGAREDGSVG